MRIDYPIAIDNDNDNDYAISNAFHNAYWLTLYFIDARGQVRHHQFGEDDYENSERVIQQLLAESHSKPGRTPQGLVSVQPTGLGAGADWTDQKSPETYVGRQRAENFVSRSDSIASRRVFASPTSLKRNQWALTGDWTIDDQFAALNKAEGRIIYRFHARDLHLVMGSSPAGSSVRFRVLLDGNPPGADAGIDIDERGAGTVTSSRLYQLIRQADPSQDRRFEIEFLDPGIRVYSFTFG